jgi:hypothetical protein
MNVRCLGHAAINQSILEIYKKSFIDLINGYKKSNLTVPDGTIYLHLLVIRMVYLFASPINRYHSGIVIFPLLGKHVGSYIWHLIRAW